MERMWPSQNWTKMIFQKHLVGCGVGSKTSVKIVIVDEGVIGTNDSIPVSTSLVDVTTTDAVAA